MTYAVDLFCGLGGWTEGLMAAGWNVIGFDVERHVYGEHEYPAQLVLQDVRTLHGEQFKDAGLIVASPPCQEYSYMAMPWRRAKQIARALRGEDEFPDNYKGSRSIQQLNELFDACVRIQLEACAAADKHIPMIIENVRGAQDWVGPARWRHGSYYIWGDVPALMPMTKALPKVGGLDWSSPDKAKRGCFRDSAMKNTGGSWFNVAHNTGSGKGRNPDGRLGNNPRAVLAGEKDGVKFSQTGAAWFDGTPRDKMRGDKGPAAYGSKSTKRKFASAMIAKIPFDLAHHIGRVYA